MAMVNFKKGLRSGLPATYAEGTFYVTTDERAIYLDVSNEARIRLGDFQEFATLEALTANTNPNTTALYYVTDINCLAKWDGSKYVQINKDTGMTSVEVTGDGNAVTAAVYSADGRKLTLTKGATYMTAADVDSKILTAVGTLGNDEEGNAYANVKAYVDAKTSGIATDAALGELQDRVSTAESDIDALQAANAEGGAVATAIATAQSAAETAQAAAEAAQATADSKTTLDEVKALDYATKAEAQGYANAKDEAIAAAQSAADDAQADVDALAEKVGEVAEGKTVVQMIADAQAAATYDDTALAGRVKTIEDDYLKAADKTELVEADAAQVERIEALEGQITGLTGAMHFKGVETEMPTDLTAYADGDVIVVGEKEYVFNNGAFVEFGDVSAEGERIAALETAVDAIEADYLKAADKTELQGNIDKKADQTAVDAIDDRVKAIEDDYLKAEDKTALQNAINAEAERAAAAEKVNSDAIAAIKDDANIDSFADVVAELAKKQNTGDYATKAEAQAMADAKDEAIEAAQAAADKAQGEVDALEQVHAADKEALEASIEANATEIAKKANSADVYLKTETYSQDEVDSLLTWGSF